MSDPLYSPRRLGAFALMLAGALIGLGGCSSLRIASHAAVPAQPVSDDQLARRVTVHGNQGALGKREQARVIERIAGAAKGELAALHLKTLAAQGEVDLYRGNSARLLVDGPDNFAAMKTAIAQARHGVQMEMYIFEDAGVAAEIGALLARKAEQGVAVALLYDDVGSLATDPAFFAALQARGVAVCAFNPVNPVRRLGYWNINHRNHRKLMVVDSEVAFTGGINISQVYASGSWRGRSKRRAAEAGWRDTQVVLRGPVVGALSASFEQMWESQGCGPRAPPKAALRSARAAGPAGDRIVKLIASEPSESPSRIYAALLSAIRVSQRSVHLTMAYFAPGAEMIDALCDAARRGVDVVLLLPGRSDFPLVLHAGRSYYEQLLDAGVEIHEMEHAILHAKTAVIDGVLSTVGSSNMDWRSLADNSELNAIVIGEAFGAEMQALFERDRADSPAIDARSWRERGLRARLLELLGRAAERWL